MDELIAVLLVIDIYTRMWFWYIKDRKSPPLSSLEFHMTKSNSGDEIIKTLKQHLDECSEENRRTFFEEFSKYRKIGRSENKEHED